MAHFAVALVIAAVAPCSAKRTVRLGAHWQGGGFRKRLEGLPKENFEILDIKWFIFHVIFLA